MTYNIEETCDIKIVDVYMTLHMGRHVSWGFLVSSQCSVEGFLVANENGPIE